MPKRPTTTRDARAEGAFQLIRESGHEALTAEDAAVFFEPPAAVVHGYAALIADNGMQYDPDAVRKALMRIAEGT